MNTKTILITGFSLAGLGVALGAFGAHALKEVLGDNGTGIWETGHLYHMLHALGIIAIGLLSLKLKESRLLRSAFFCMLLGIICFSGSLYLLALPGAWSWLGPITPIGGILFIISWILLIIATIKDQSTLVQQK